MSFPTKEERERCWGARDKYWECLDKNGEKDTVVGGPCTEFRKLYVKSCSAQWVKHFDRKWSYLQYKHKIETEGYEPLDNEKIPNQNVNDRNLNRKRRIYSEIAIT